MLDRVRRGEVTERGLARLTGVSQPHIHNVLKGKRLLSISMADQMLRQLRLDVCDLLCPGECGDPSRPSAGSGTSQNPRTGIF
jgi:transcriptional regulator with XRE-family HTH domain